MAFDSAIEDIAQRILELERAALDRWGRGAPSGFLELTEEDVVYFDPFLPRRLRGIPALTRYYEGLRGKVSVARDEVIEPCVQVLGETAVLTYDYVSYDPAGALHAWHCTEVFRNTQRGWRIIQTHWSFAAQSDC